MNVCTVCGKVGTFQCSSCKSVYYCSRDHQKQDWPQHKELCKKIASLPYNCKGIDSDNKPYSNVLSLWEEYDNKDKWYKKATDYWKGVVGTDVGMLGGQRVGAADAAASARLLGRYFSERKGMENDLYALDCGGGVGRVAEGVLATYFAHVDIVDQSQAFLDVAEQRRDKTARWKGECFCSGLQNFVFSRSYDVVWVQWVIIYLNDSDLIAFCKRAKSALKDGGYLIIKDNVASNGFWVDKADSSIIRSLEYYESLFAAAGMCVRRRERQDDMPKDLFDVYTWVLQ